MKLLILALTVSAVYASTFQVGWNFKPALEKRQLYSSKLLHYVQMSGMFSDSKTFVDMRMKRDERSILVAFDELLVKTHDRPSKEQLAEFINYNFDSESGLESWRPSDFVSEPRFLASIKDSQLQQFARSVYNILPTLGRKMKPIVFKNPELFSIIPVHSGFMVPGAKSQEFNYMDSYWMIESLLISGMRETAKGMISNFIELQRQFGYIPSGDRYYYLGRSQPPLLSAMMAIYLQETNDVEFLRANIDAIEGELEYWLDSHSVEFNVAGREYSLLRYITQCRGPRPEAYYQDFTNAQVFDNEQRQEQFFTDMKSAGESGWGMSSRWIMNKNGSNLGDISYVHTTDIVPVDLNAIFASAVQNVANFYSVLNDSRRGAHWLEIRKRWINTIREVLWNEAEGMWFDWDLQKSQHRQYFYTSNLSPLWMGAVEPEFMQAKSQKIMNYLRKTHILEFPGGVPASLIKSGYLYDLPYAWPAQVSIVVSALEALQTEESSKMAFEVAQNLVRSMNKAYLTNKQLYAKYDVESIAKPLVGSAGYLNEEEFGSTLAVIIEMLAKYGTTMTSVRGYIPFPSKFGQYSQFYSTSAPQIVNQYSYAAFTDKPVAKPEWQVPSKPVFYNSYQKPSAAPVYWTQTSYLPSNPTKPTLVEIKPEATTLKEEEYISTTFEPEYTTVAPIQPYQLPVQTPQKPALVAEAKPAYVSYTVKPSIVAPVKPVQALPLSKPSYVAPVPLKPEYVSVETKPELLEKKPEYLPLAPVPQKPAYLPVAPVPQKPAYLPVAPVPQKPAYLPVAPVPQKPEYLPVAPVPQKPEYLPVAPVPQKPEYLPVAPVPQKPLYLSIDSKPEAQLLEKKQELPVVEAKPELVKPLYPAPAQIKPALVIEAKPAQPAKPLYQSIVAKPEYVAVPAKPEPELLEKKPEYVAELKPEVAYNKPLYPAPAQIKPALVIEAKPEVAPIAQPAKPLYQSIVAKPEYVAVPAKPEPELLEKKPEYVAELKPEVAYNKPLYPTPAPVKPALVIEAKPEVAPIAYPAKPLYQSIVAKPEYVAVPAKPEPELLEKKPEYVAELKPEVAYNKPLYPAPAQIKPALVIEAKPEVAPIAYPAKPLYQSIVAKPEYVAVPAKPEPELLEKKPEYVAELKPEVAYNKPLYPAPSPIKPFVITAKPEVAPVAYPAKPLYTKPVQVSYVAPLKPLEAKPESQLFDKKPEYVAEAKPELSLNKEEEILSSTTLEPEYLSTTEKLEQVSNTVKPELTWFQVKPKPTFAPLPSWPKYNAFVKPLNNVQVKPEYSSTTEAELEISTTLAPKYEATTTSKPEQVTLYAAKPSYSSWPIKHEFVQPAKPAYGSQSLYFSTAKPFFASTKSPLVYSVPLKPLSQQVSYTSSSYHQPGYLIPAVPEVKHTTAYPATTEYESSTVVEPEYTTLAAAYTTESEYPSTTLASEFEYATTESQLLNAKPQFGYLSVQSKPQAAALSISASAEKKPYFAGYSSFSSQRNELPKVQTTYVSSVHSQSGAELLPAVSVSIPAKQEAQSQISTEEKATVLQQSHFSFFDKPTAAPVVIISTLAPKPEGFSTYTKFNLNSASVNVTKVNSTAENTYTNTVTAKPQFSFGSFGSGYVFNKTVTPSAVTSTVNVHNLPAKNQWWTQSQSNWQSQYNRPQSYSYSKNNRYNSYSNQYQSGQYQGQYNSQFNSGAYNSGLYRPQASTTVKSPLPVAPLFSAVA